MRIRRRLLCALACLAAFTCVAQTSAAPPRVSDDRLTLTQLAAEPTIVHPTAIDIGPDGRLYVVENHTHFPPKDYDGLKHDRVLAFDVNKPDAPPVVFHEGTDKSMGLTWGAGEAKDWLYIVGRSVVTRVRDTDGDGKADQAERVVHLDTTADYPHNAMAGIAVGPDGLLYIGCGENSGVDYKVVGSDGSGFAINDGTGNIIRCTLDGKNVEQLATGFWNPFGLAFHPNGELFAAENDPDASPPCRLIHVVPGGDYGFRFMYGRAGLHPLLAWDGELPGTLGMVTGTGESPCEIVTYKGHLIVASWADHRIEVYTLAPTGGTYRATMRTLVTGGEDFRPVGLALSPDGKTLYFSDWVDRSYQLHKKGRVWKMEGIDEVIEAVDVADPKSVQMSELKPEHDAFQRTRAAYQHAAWMRKTQFDPKTADAAASVASMMLFRHLEIHESAIPAALKSDDADIRLLAVRWIADKRLKQHRPLLDDVLASDVMTPQLFICTVAAMEWLDTGKTTGGNGAAPPRALLDALRGDDSPDRMRLLALRMLGPDHAAVTIDLLERFIYGDDIALRVESARSLAARTKDDRTDLLRKVAADTELEPLVRAEAIVGLSAAPDKHADLLKKLADDEHALVADEAGRALRTQPPAVASRPLPNDIDGWMKLTADMDDADVDTGRRLFFNQRLTQCSRCHAVDGRGGDIGPDLSLIARRADRRFLLESLLDPSREIAPYFRPWQLTMKDGSTRVGMLLATGGQGGHQPYVDAAGVKFQLPSNDIADRTLLETSLMPPYLIGMLTDAEIRDLLAYLLSRK